MTFALLAVLPACTLKRPLLLAQVAIWCVVLALSLDRSAWLAFAVGTTIYAAIGARRSTTIGAFAGIAVLATVAVMAVPIMTGDELALAHLTDRFSTLSDVENDRSANDRQAVYVEGTQMFLAAPLGEGLGVIGTATKLGDTQTTTDFDSGYLARLVELGIPGGALFYAALAILLAAFVGRWRAASRADDDIARNDASFAVAFCFALFGLQLAGDVYAGFMSLLLWMVAGCVVPARTVVARASDAPTPVVRPTFATLRSGAIG
jgi:O-antigen ligase